jgi:hypothetical protein
LDILAFRFPRAQADVIRRQGRQRVIMEDTFLLDPLLRCSPEHPDMIVGEVKEGTARFNEAVRDPAVLAIALARFGCCGPEYAGDMAQRLVADGRADTPEGHTVRMVAFGTAPEGASDAQATIVPMHHVVEFLRGYLHRHWDVLRHAQLKDPALDVLALSEKWGAATPAPAAASTQGTHSGGPHHPAR